MHYLKEPLDAGIEIMEGQGWRSWHRRGVHNRQWGAQHGAYSTALSLLVTMLGSTVLSVVGPLVGHVPQGPRRSAQRSAAHLLQGLSCSGVGSGGTGLGLGSSLVLALGVGLGLELGSGLASRVGHQGGRRAWYMG